VFAQVQLVRDFPVRQAFRYQTRTVSSRFAEIFMGDSGSQVLGFSAKFHPDKGRTQRFAPTGISLAGCGVAVV
jgi:hypothetical protein